MLYYVYKIHPPGRLEYVDEFDAYRDARTRVRAMRRKLPPAGASTVRMILAASREQAEHLLTQPREARPLGEDA